jgi:2-keto-4-pentenoate hydratase
MNRDVTDDEVEETRMTIDDDVVHDIARRLLRAEAGGTPIEPIRDEVGRNDVDAAYEIQSACVRRWLDLGRTVVGRKIGLTNPAVQRQLGVDRPDFGSLFADMAYASGDVIPFRRVLQARVEAEMALVLSSDLTSADVTPDEIARATGHVVAALEIVGSRIAGWRIGIVDTIADNASSGAFVLGTQHVELATIDVVAATMQMTRTSSTGEVEQVSAGTGADCLGNPLIAAAWLAAEMVRRGTPLRAGDIVLTGALGPMVTVRPGDVFTATITGLGDVTAQFGVLDAD